MVGASRGESVDITCEVEADPPAKTYRWKFNNSGETLDVAAERFSGTSNGTVSILRYTPVTELDYGSLSCWATNVVGHQVNPCIFQVVAAGEKVYILALNKKDVLSRRDNKSESKIRSFRPQYSSYQSIIS